MNGQNELAASLDSYSAITREIESLLRVRDLMGEWTANHLKRYEELCVAERAALARMGELFDVPPTKLRDRVMAAVVPSRTDES
jgi:hypothetical protein